jgi:hypothetical protein
MALGGTVTTSNAGKQELTPAEKAAKKAAKAAKAAAKEAATAAATAGRRLLDFAGRL